MSWDLWDQTVGYLGEIRAYLHERDWRTLEDRFFTVCQVLAGNDRSKQIADVSLTSYEVELSLKLASAVGRAKDQGAVAVFFHYDLDNSWQSTIFICDEYQRESPQWDPAADDWACDWVDSIIGPSLLQFAEIYQEDSSFNATPFAMGSTMYLVARTTGAFIRAGEGLERRGLAICIGYHDGDVMRLFEADPSLMIETEPL